jgi:hypothetical protein
MMALIPEIVSSTPRRCPAALAKGPAKQNGKIASLRTHPAGRITSRAGLTWARKSSSASIVSSRAHPKFFRHTT